MAENSIVSNGRFVPIKRTRNAEIESELQLEPGWIYSRTGIESRAIADADDAVSDLAFKAGSMAINEYANAGNRITDIGTLLLATSTPDHLLPPSSPKLGFDLGLQSVAAMDVTVACSGFLYALILADAICSSSRKHVLVIAANILSRRCRKDDVTTRPIFADAAGAVVLAPTPGRQGILSSCWASDGSQSESLLIPEGGSRRPFGPDTFKNDHHLMKLADGAAVFKYAVQSMADMGQQAVRNAGLSIADIDWWIPHQASRRIIDATRRILKIEEAKTLTTVEHFGNSSAATIPVTLDYYLKVDPRIQSGDLVLMTAAAAGMTSAAVLIQMK